MKSVGPSKAIGYVCLLLAFSLGSCGEGVVGGGGPDDCPRNTSWDGTRCVPDSREARECTDLPENASWNTVSEITQTWDGEKWAPSTTATHGEEPSTTECRFRCDANYSWNEARCMPDSRHDQDCTGLPRHASWNTASSITQTWDGEDWAPATTATYDEEPSSTECRFVCEGGYDWDGIRCELPPYFEETWWIAADAHIGSHRDGELNALPNLQAAIADLNALGESQKAIMLGDFVHDSPAHLADYEDAMNRLNHSWIDVLGNHDFDRHGSGARVKPRTFFSRNMGGVRFVAVSDDGRWNSGNVVEGYQTEKNLMQDQDDWFRAELDSAPGTPTILMTHQGLWRHYENPNDDGACFWDRNRRGWLQDDWEKYNIPMWLRGHNHTWRLNENYRGLGVVDVSPGSTTSDTGGGILMTVKQERGSTTLTLRFRTLGGNWTSVAGYSEYRLEIIFGIHDWHDLDDVRRNLGGSHVLMSDLDESSPGYEDYNSGEGWRPLGASGDEFSGSFDGQGHTISGLVIDGSMAGAGLFGYVRNATISNLGILDARVSTTESRAGALAGEIHDSTVSDCYSTGEVSTTGRYNAGGLLGRAGGRSIVERSWSSARVVHDWSDGAGSNAGGLIGRTGEQALLTESFATGSVDGNANVGGLVGRSGGGGESTRIADSHARGEATGSASRVGGLVGRNYGLISRTFSTGGATGEGSVGGLVGINEPEGAVNDSFWDTESSSLETSSAGTGLSTADMKDRAVFAEAGWDFLRTWSTHTEVNDGYPFLPATRLLVVEIRDWHDLDAVRDNLSWHYVLMNDLDSDTPGYDDLNTGDGWEPIGTSGSEFSGTFDGRGHDIRGLRSRGDREAGLFGATLGAEISYLGLLDAEISNTATNAGALVGVATDTVISSCYSTGWIASTGRYNAGGLLGRAGGRSLVTQSWSTAEVTHDWSDGNGANAGGLVGRLGDNAEISQSFAGGGVHGNANVGGLVGRSGGADEATKVSESFARGDALGSGTRVGGLVGRNFGHVFDAYSTGGASGEGNAGGLIGVNQAGAVVMGGLWDTQTSGLAESAAGSGRNTDQMTAQSTFATEGFNLASYWVVDASINDGYPHLLRCKPLLD